MKNFVDLSYYIFPLCKKIEKNLNFKGRKEKKLNVSLILIWNNL